MSVESLLARILNLADEGLRRARVGDAFFIELDEGTGYDTLTVITDVGFIHVIPENKATVIKSVYLHMMTPSDEAHVQMGYTENADGTGTFTPLDGNMHLETPAAVVNMGTPAPLYLDPPIYVKDTQGKAITCRIIANDAAAEISVCCRGWDEAYRRLSN